MYYSVIIKNWDEIKAISSKSFHFIFRGHAQKDWKLKPTLERAADKYLMKYNLLFSHEYLIYREFKSVANHYLTHLPEGKNYLEWMTILQHYGAPTRLLDFSHSLYIAAFFAFEFSTEDSAIWALNRYKLDSLLIDKMELDSRWKSRNLVFHDYTIDVANKLFDYENEENIFNVRNDVLDHKKIIFSVTPDSKNERLAIQKGVFLMPSNLEESFENILIKQFDLDFDNLTDENSKRITIDELLRTKLSYETCMFKLIIPRKVCLDGLYDLRNMNINAATLFPGLDGQARSLNMIMRSMEDISLELASKKSLKNII